MYWNHSTFKACFKDYPLEGSAGKYTDLRPEVHEQGNNYVQLSYTGKMKIIDYMKASELGRQLGRDWRRMREDELPYRTVSRPALSIYYIPTPYCCGSGTIFGLQVDNSIIPTSPRNRMALLAQAAADTINAAEVYAKVYCGRHHLLYYVADGQSYILKGLKKRGFKKKDSFYNPNSGNAVWLYTKYLSPEELE